MMIQRGGRLITVCWRDVFPLATQPMMAPLCTSSERGSQDA